MLEFAVKIIIIEFLCKLFGTNENLLRVFTYYGT